jgi:hypothetical protein
MHRPRRVVSPVGDRARHEAVHARLGRALLGKLIGKLERRGVLLGDSFPGIKPRNV